MDIKKVVEDSLDDYSVDLATRTQKTEDQFCQSDGAITRNIEETLGLNNKETKKILNKAVKDGLIIRNKPDIGAWIRWLPVGYLAKVRKAL